MLSTNGWKIYTVGGSFDGVGLELPLRPITAGVNVNQPNKIKSKLINVWDIVSFTIIADMLVSVNTAKLHERHWQGVGSGVRRVIRALNHKSSYGFLTKKQAQTILKSN